MRVGGRARFEAGGAAVCTDRCVVARPVVRPAITATALIRDADGGTGSIRVSVVSATRCDGTDRQHTAYFPPAQIQAIRVAPGVRVPVQSTHRAQVRFAAGCEVLGKVFAEATNASGVESFSDPIWFAYRPRGSAP